MASNIAQQRIQREFREVIKSEEVAASGVQVRYTQNIEIKTLRFYRNWVN